MIHYMPTVHSSLEGYERIGELARAAKGLYADRLELNFSRARFFEASGNACGVM